MEKITVIVPVYNVEKYLRGCLESIIHQTFYPYQVILVDDESTDNSGSICDEYAKKYKYVEVIHKKNEGLGLARNTGLDNATGDYVVFIDSDDYADLTLLENLIVARRKYGSDTCLGGYKRVDSKNQYVGEFPYDEVNYSGKQILQTLLPRMIGSSPESSDCIGMAAWNVLYSMEIINKHKIRFVSERILISEDIIFNLKYYKYANNATLIKETNYNYRINEGTLTTKYRSNRFKLIKILYTEEEKMLKELGIYDTCKYRLMRQFFNYLRMCFAQESYEISHKKTKDIIASIAGICKDELVQAIISEYPQKCLNIKQRVFLMLVSRKCCITLYTFIKFRVIAVS
ncbi:glycosyltransferase family 2 protein [Clostridium chromiireducens]|uniref:glycosyltransferase family 2 protein n=1 Tax=Clostridium chromiireducens TaxID=225345 RepID=UPI003AF6579C